MTENSKGAASLGAFSADDIVGGMTRGRGTVSEVDALIAAGENCKFVICLEQYLKVTNCLLNGHRQIFYLHHSSKWD